MQITASILSVIQQKLSEYFSSAHQIHFTAISGGSINQTYQVNIGNAAVFCKVNSAAAFPYLFQKEKAGLELIAKQNVIKTPLIIDCFETDGSQLLLLEWIREGEKKEAFWKTFGEHMAALHSVSNNAFGLHEDNYMGNVPQSNRQHKTWTGFFAAERLQPMIKRCYINGLLSTAHLHQFEKLKNRLSELFEEEKPSLIHGDLWSGNFMCNEKSEPVLIDPAIYYGHRSMDLAMTTLFGGFRQPFYDAYNHHVLLAKNHEEHWAVCNLYPLLIHLHLFGASYLPQIERTLLRFA